MQNFQFVRIGEEFLDPIGGERWVKISSEEAQLVSNPDVIESFERYDITED